MSIQKTGPKFLLIAAFFVASFVNEAHASMRDFMDMCVRPIDKPQKDMSQAELKQVMFRLAGLDPLSGVNSFGLEISEAASNVKITYHTVPVPSPRDDYSEELARIQRDSSVQGLGPSGITAFAFAADHAKVEAENVQYDIERRNAQTNNQVARAQAEQLASQFHTSFNNIFDSIRSYLYANGRKANDRASEVSCKQAYKNIIKSKTLFIHSITEETPITDLNHLSLFEDEINSGRIDTLGFYRVRKNSPGDEALDISAIAGLTGLKNLAMISSSSVFLGVVDLTPNNSLVEVQLVGFGLNEDQIVFKPEHGYKRVNLSSNYFESLDFSTFQSLEMLDIASNALSNIQLPTKADDLEFLDLSDNLLTLASIGGLKALDRLPKLRYLDLRNNSFSTDEITQLNAYMKKRSITLPPEAYESDDLPFDLYMSVLNLYKDIDSEILGILDSSEARQMTSVLDYYGFYSKYSRGPFSAPFNLFAVKAAK